MQLERYSGNPILSPHPGHPWEDLAVLAVTSVVMKFAWYDRLKEWDLSPEDR